MDRRPAPPRVPGRLPGRGAWPSPENPDKKIKQKGMDRPPVGPSRPSCCSLSPVSPIRSRTRRVGRASPRRSARPGPAQVLRAGRRPRLSLEPAPAPPVAGSACAPRWSRAAGARAWAASAASLGGAEEDEGRRRKGAAWRAQPGGAGRRRGASRSRAPAGAGLGGNAGPAGVRPGRSVGRAVEERAAQGSGAWARRAAAARDPRRCPGLARGARGKRGPGGWGPRASQGWGSGRRPPTWAPGRELRGQPGRGAPGPEPGLGARLLARPGLAAAGTSGSPSPGRAGGAACAVVPERGPGRPGAPPARTAWIAGPARRQDWEASAARTTSGIGTVGDLARSCCHLASGRLPAGP